MKQKFNFSSPIHLATAKDDEFRPHMACVWFRNGYAYASDAHILVKQSLELSTVVDADKLNGHELHRDAFDKILKYQFATATDEGVECVGKNGEKAFFQYYKLEDGKQMPDAECILESIFSNEVESIDVIGINPKMIARLGKAMAGDNYHCSFEFRGNHRAIIVKRYGAEYDDQIGLVMPASLI